MLENCYLWRASLFDQEEKEKEGEENGDTLTDLQGHSYLDAQIAMRIDWHIPFIHMLFNYTAVIYSLFSAAVAKG